MFGALLWNLRRTSGLGWRQKPGSSREPVCPPLRQDEGATPVPVPSPSHALTPDPSPLSTLSCLLSTADQTHPTLGCSTGIQVWIHAEHPCPALDLHPFVRAWSRGVLLEMPLTETAWAPFVPGTRQQHRLLMFPAGPHCLLIPRESPLSPPGIFSLSPARRTEPWRFHQAMPCLSPATHIWPHAALLLLLAVKEQLPLL